jgi:hypothetical protein
MKPGLNGNAALVRGTNRGIGAAIAIELVKHHRRLAARDRVDIALKFQGRGRMKREARPPLRKVKGNTVEIGSRCEAGKVRVNVATAITNLGVEHGVRIAAINPGLTERKPRSRNIERIPKAEFIHVAIINLECGATGSL